MAAVCEHPPVSGFPLMYLMILDFTGDPPPPYPYSSLPRLATPAKAPLQHGLVQDNQVLTSTKTRKLMWITEERHSATESVERVSVF